MSKKSPDKILGTMAIQQLVDYAQGLSGFSVDAPEKLAGIDKSVRKMTDIIVKAARVEAYKEMIGHAVLVRLGSIKRHLLG